MRRTRALPVLGADSSLPAVSRCRMARGLGQPAAAPGRPPLLPGLAVSAEGRAAPPRSSPPPGGTCTNLELLRGSESPTSPSPCRPRPAPGRPLARCLGAAEHRFPLSPSQFGRAERRASPGCGRRDLGATPGAGAGAPGARAARGQGGGSWFLGGRAERRCRQGGRLPMDVCGGRRIKEQKARGGGGSHSCTKPPPPLPPRRSRRLLRRK